MCRMPIGIVFIDVLGCLLSIKPQRWKSPSTAAATRLEVSQPYLPRVTDPDAEANTVFTVAVAFLLQPENSAVISVSVQERTFPVSPSIVTPVPESEADRYSPKPLPVTVSTFVRLEQTAESMATGGVTVRFIGLLVLGPLAART